MAKNKKLSLSDLLKVDLDSLHINDRIKVQELIKELKVRKLNYPILDFTPQPHQEEVLNAVKRRQSKS